jgi:hypothetical protein
VPTKRRSSRYRGWHGGQHQAARKRQVPGALHPPEDRQAGLPYLQTEGRGEGLAQGGELLASDQPRPASAVSDNVRGVPERPCMQAGLHGTHTGAATRGLVLDGLGTKGNRSTIRRGGAVCGCARHRRLTSDPQIPIK